jgi:hypothetical protein
LYLVWSFNKINRAAVNIHAQVGSNLFYILFDKYLGVECFDHTVMCIMCMLNFLRNYQPISQSDCTILYFTSIIGEFQFSTFCWLLIWLVF